MQTVFEAAGGNDGLRRLADAWHRRAIACFDQALADAGLANNDALRQVNATLLASLIIQPPTCTSLPIRSDQFSAHS